LKKGGQGSEWVVVVALGRYMALTDVVETKRSREMGDAEIGDAAAKPHPSFFSIGYFGG